MSIFLQHFPSIQRSLLFARPFSVGLFKITLSSGFLPSKTTADYAGDEHVNAPRTVPFLYWLICKSKLAAV